MTRTAFAFRMFVGALMIGCGGGESDAPTDGGTATGMDARVTADAETTCDQRSAEDTASACGNGVDDDCDRYSDCEDFDCCDLVSCGPETTCGRRDAGRPSMQCPGAPEPENTPTACSDGCSNDNDDGDGGVSRVFVDCDDYDCCDVVTCGPQTNCGRRRDAGVACQPLADENTLAACTNGCDDGDEDTFGDCNDRDCCLIRLAAEMPCGASSFCGSDFEPEPAGAGLCEGDDIDAPPAAEDCGNGCDDDRDGFQDGADYDCRDGGTDRGAR